MAIRREGTTNGRVRGDKTVRTVQDGTVSWTVILPVKRLELAKSRLRGAVEPAVHEELALAMALDTVAAALASPVAGRAVVVSADRSVRDAAAGLGAEVIRDVPDAGLNPALAYATTLVRPRGSAASLPGVAALAADLPALRAQELTEALRAAEAGDTIRRAFVSDAAGTGTVLLAARPGVGLEPCFGAGSAAAHAVSGAMALPGDWPSLRRDVDTADDLIDAIRLGVGPRTGAIVLSGGLLLEPDLGGADLEAPAAGGVLVDPRAISTASAIGVLGG
jgi:2-phospho-L-lactate/phosphoenolpyruvate guanylyltransferase